MPLWEIVVDGVGALLGLVLLYGVALVVRRRVIARDGGTFELSYRARSERAGRGWLLGVGRYSDERLEWFRIFSLSFRPKMIWQRTDLSYEGRRAAVGPEEMALYPDHLVIVCRDGRGAEVELAMGPASLTGFQAWLEAKPPGAQMPGAQMP